LFTAGESDVSNFFIILSGSVFLTEAAASQPTEDSDTGGHRTAPAKGAEILGRTEKLKRLRSETGKTRPRKQSQSPVRKSKSDLQTVVVHEEFVATLGPGDSFGEEAILCFAESDRHVADAHDSFCAKDYRKRNYSATCGSGVVELLVVHEDALLASMLKYGVDEFRLRSSLSLDSLVCISPFGAQRCIPFPNLTSKILQRAKPATRTHLQSMCVERIISTAGIFMRKRPPSHQVIKMLANVTEYCEAENGDILYLQVFASS
jgi:CRP-like cAMP-binding protein